jgi:hypothetical protein
MEITDDYRIVGKSIFWGQFIIKISLKSFKENN